MIGKSGGRALPGDDDSTPVWLFDLDNTLYPPNTGLMDALSARISLYLERHLSLPPLVAEQVRAAYFGAYGSSVRGVLMHCRVDAEDLLAFIHDLPVGDYLSPSPKLARLLSSIPGRKSVFTNATAEYARRALHALGIEDLFERIFDIHFSDLEGKPAPAAYQKVLRALGPLNGPCWLVEDTLANLVPAKAFGCRTVWITSNGASRSPSVDFTIRDLAELKRIAETAVRSMGLKISHNISTWRGPAAPDEDGWDCMRIGHRFSKLRGC